MSIEANIPIITVSRNKKEIQNHISFIEQEIKISKKDSRMLELKNWLEYLKVA